MIVKDSIAFEGLTAFLGLLRGAPVQRKSALCGGCHGLKIQRYASPSSTLDESGIRIDTTTTVCLTCPDCHGTGVSS